MRPLFVLHRDSGGGNRAKHGGGGAGLDVAQRFTEANLLTALRFQCRAPLHRRRPYPPCCAWRTSPVITGKDERRRPHAATASELFVSTLRCEGGRACTSEKKGWGLRFRLAHSLRRRMG